MSKQIEMTGTPEKALITEIRGAALLGAVALGAFGLLLDRIWQAGNIMAWLLIAACLWAFVIYQGGRRLDRNRPSPEAALYSSLGWATRLTLLRAWLIACVGGFLWQPWPETALMSWVPGIAYLVAAVIDRVDGFVARRTGHSSLLGGELDTISDALGIAIVSLLAYDWGQVHASYLLVGVAYYAFIAGTLWREYRGKPVYPLPPALHRRAWAGFQMGFLVVAIWPLFYPPITTVAGFAFMLPALIGFLLDWFFVSGRLHREAQAVDRLFSCLTTVSLKLLQPLMRLVITGLIVMTLWSQGFELLPLNDWHNLLLLAGFGLGAVLVLTGLAARAANLLLVGMIGWYHTVYPLEILDAALLCTVIWSMLLGPGRYSLWLADDLWVNRYDGA